MQGLQRVFKIVTLRTAKMWWHQPFWEKDIRNWHHLPTISATSFAVVTDKDNHNFGQDHSHVPLSSLCLIKTKPSSAQGAKILRGFLMHTKWIMPLTSIWVLYPFSLTMPKTKVVSGKKNNNKNNKISYPKNKKTKQLHLKGMLLNKQIL